MNRGRRPNRIDNPFLRRQWIPTSRFASGEPRWSPSSATQQHLPGSGGSPTSAPPSSLLSLPDNILVDLMTLLDQSCFQSKFIPDGATLASTNSHLDVLYRNACVNNLALELELTQEKFERLLRRHPRADFLTLTWTQVVDFAASINVALHTLNVTDFGPLFLYGETRTTNALDSISGLLKKNRELKELRCNISIDAPAGPLANMLAAVPPQLKVLSLRNAQIDDPSGARLVRQLYGLEELRLDSSPQIAQLTFDAIATLPELKTLSLSDTNFSNADAARVFPQMAALQHLNVCDCRSITAGLWNALPPKFALTRLDANETKIFTAVPNGQRGLDALRELAVSPPTNGEGITDWGALVQKFGMLRVLSLSWSENLGDVHVHAAFENMPHLENLNLNGCRTIGGPTFDAIGALPALAELHLERTAFSDADAARCLPHMRALRVLKVTNCEQICSALWETLPPSLRDLYAEYTSLLEHNVGNGNRAKWLRLLHATAPPCDAAWVDGWAALPGGLNQLRQLQLEGAKTGDSAMEDALRRMPRLESLNLEDCGVTEERAAKVITGHPKLQRVELWDWGDGEDVTRSAKRVFGDWEREHWTGNRRVEWHGKKR